MSQLVFSEVLFPFTKDGLEYAFLSLPHLPFSQELQNIGFPSLCVSFTFIQLTTGSDSPPKEFLHPLKVQSLALHRWVFGCLFGLGLLSCLVTL